MNRRVLLPLVVVGVVLGAGFSTPQTNSASVTGTWSLVVDAPKGSITTTLTLTQSGEKVSGKLKRGANEDDVAGTIKDKKIVLEAKIVRDGETVVQTYRGTLTAADKMNGTMAMSNEPPTRLLIWNATKK